MILTVISSAHFRRCTISTNSPRWAITSGMSERRHSDPSKTTGLLPELVRLSTPFSLSDCRIDPYSTDCMLALSTLEQPLFPLYIADVESKYSSTRTSPEPSVRTSELGHIVDNESLEMLSEIQTLAEDFDHFSDRVSIVSDLDDIEYRCVSIQHRLLSFEYKSLTFTTSSDAETWAQTLQGCCRLTMLIYFGKLHLASPLEIT
jgi:hypothetical protein